MGKPIKHYGGFRIRWFDPAVGRRRSETYETYKEAALALHKHELAAEEFRRGGTSGPPPDKTFEDLADYWKKHRVPAKKSGSDDVSMLNRHLLPAFGKLLLRQITVERIDEFTAKLTTGTKTEYNIRTLLTAMLRFAVEELRWLRERPKIRRPKLELIDKSYSYLRTKEEIRRFLAAARAKGEHLHAFYATAICTGMRAGELAGLHWKDVDLDARLIIVRYSYDGSTKAGYDRVVPIVDDLLPVLRAWEKKRSSALVFPNRAGEMHGESARIFQETFHAVLRAAGFADVERRGKLRPAMTFHALRHTFASHWVLAGGTTFKLRQVGGWRSEAMVQRYAHLAPNAFVEDYGRFAGVTSPGGPSTQSGG